MTLIEIFTIIFAHWVLDFVLQTHKEAIGKSHDIKMLLSHTFKYSILWIPVLVWFSTKPSSVLLFVLITFIAHTVTDYFTSKLNKKLLPSSARITMNSDSLVLGDKNLICYPANKSWHNFFVGIGFDQVLHYVQLFLTFYLLFK